MEPVNVNEFNSDEFRKFLSSFDYVFSDCDGVIWSSGPLPGSGKFFELIKNQGKAVHYVSNNSLRTKENYEANFAASNIDNGFENLTIPSTAIAEYLKSINLKKKVYCVTCTETIRILESNGFQCKYGAHRLGNDVEVSEHCAKVIQRFCHNDFVVGKSKPDIGADYYAEYLQYLEDDEEIGAVVFDSDFKVNLPKLYKAITYLKRPEVVFVSGATDRIVPLKPGTIALGTGVFTDMVAEQTNRAPVQLGKPGKEFGEFAMKRAGVTDPSRVLFIGDMIEQDIGLGKATGFKTLLVLTNTTKEDMMAHPTIRPDYYAESLGSIVPLF